jgi:ligand-binding sensor domain-containing protein
MNAFRNILLTLLLLCLLPLGSGFAAAQPIGTWQSFTSQSTVLDLVQDPSDRIWSVTGGGIFMVEDGEIVMRLTTTDGMYRINPQSVVYDEGRELLWLGYSDGMFEAYDPGTELFRQYSDIARATRFSPRGINRMVLMDGDLLLATDFGLVLFDPDREVTVDTWSNLGMFPSGSRVNSVMLHGGQVFAATADGVAVSDPGADDLVVPDSWTSYGQESGLGSNVTGNRGVPGCAPCAHGGCTSCVSLDRTGRRPVSLPDLHHHITVSQNGEYLAGWNDTRILLDPLPQGGTAP